MRRYILAAVVALALWPNLVPAAEISTFYLKTTRDLLDVCTTPESDALRKEAVHYCLGFVVGAVGYHNALAELKDMKRITCYPEGTTREDGVRVFIAWAQARQGDSTLMNESPIVGLMRSLTAQWPCKGGR
jgi:Ssp1 endopeptidase immunity protein Rap1a